ncbi:MAG: hypothetical protein ACXVUE_02965 [Solirubrobacteraceae bacterium]
MPRKVATALGVVTCVAGIGLVWGAGADAFTGTPAALRLINRVRAQTARFPAVRLVPTGSVVYCQQVPLGWIDLPVAGCREPARVTETFDLAGGRVVRVISEVTARSRSSIRSVASAGGWFQLDEGLDCWFSFPMRFVKPLLVDFPFPGERLRIVAANRTVVLLGASAPRYRYRELDYVNPVSDLIYRVDEFNSLGRKTYHEIDRLTYLFRRPRVSPTTPVCA